MDPVEALRRCHGVASWRRLAALGVTRHHLLTALDAGRLHRADRNLYVLDDASPDLHQQVQTKGVLSCASAAAHHRLPLLRPPRLHLTVSRHGHSRQAPGAVLHRRDLVHGDHDGVATGLARTVLDCAREMSRFEAVAVGDGALQAGLDLGQLAAAAHTLRGPGGRLARSVVAELDPGSESILETAQRLLVPAEHTVRSQVFIPGAGRVDLLIDGWLILEADGFAHHSARDAFANDRRRDLLLHELGYTVLRLTYDSLIRHPEIGRRAIAAVLARRTAS